MSTASNAVAAPEIPRNISGGLTLLAKRLLPAKLHTAEDAAGKKNGFYFNALVIAKGMVLTGPNAMTAAAIADSFYQAVVADCQSPLPQLVWVVAPKALTKRAQSTPTTREDARNASTFEEKVRASEKDDAARRLQEQAKAEALEAVANFHPLNHRSGRLNYTVETEKKAEWRKRIVEHKGDFITLKKELLQEIRDLYRAAEKAAERV